MAQKDMIEMSGTVLEVLPASTYRVELENGHLALATVAGRARRSVRVSRGDLVVVELSTYDRTRGRIIAKRLIDDAA